MDDAISLFNEIVSTLLKEEKKKPVADYVPTNKLYEDLDLSLNAEPIDDAQFKSALEKLVLKTPRTATNAFFNQLFDPKY